MATEAVLALARVNLALAAAVLFVLAVRPLFLRWFGARVAYALWVVVPCAGLAGLVPARTGEGGAAYALALPTEVVRFLEVPGRAGPILSVWAIGVAVSLLLLALGQARFLRLARQGRAGPAVVGVFAPRIVAPRGYWESFSPEEHRLIRAHERAHIERGDPRAIAVSALVQVLAWFNPLVHLGARRMRRHLELACDATVLETLGERPRRYAETLLKSHLVDLAPPLGCHWSAPRIRPLEERLRNLGRPTPAPRARLAGFAGVAALAVCLGAAVWLVRPPQPPHPSFTYKDPRSVMIVDLTPAPGARPSAASL